MTHPITPPTSCWMITAGTTHTNMTATRVTGVTDAQMDLLPSRHRVNGLPPASGSTAPITNGYTRSPTPAAAKLAQAGVLGWPGFWKDRRGAAMGKGRIRTGLEGRPCLHVLARVLAARPVRPLRRRVDRPRCWVRSSVGTLAAQGLAPLSRGSRCRGSTRAARVEAAGSISSISWVKLTGVSRVGSSDGRYRGGCRRYGSSRGTVVLSRTGTGRCVRASRITSLSP